MRSLDNSPQKEDNFPEHTGRLTKESSFHLKFSTEFNLVYKKGKKEIAVIVDLSILLYIESLSINKRMMTSGMRNIPGIL